MPDNKAGLRRKLWLVAPALLGIAGLVILGVLIFGRGSPSDVSSRSDRRSAGVLSPTGTAGGASSAAPGSTIATPVPPVPVAMPGDGTIYWGAAIDGVPWDMAKLTDFETRVGKHMSIVHFWQFWEEDGQLQPFHPEPLDAVWAHGAIPMVTWPSERLGGGSDQVDFQLSAIINGDYDRYIHDWARAARTWGHPFFLRFDHEMNVSANAQPGGPTFPWSESANGNRRGQFVPAWRHVHDIFAAEGATNATWVWCPNVTFPRSSWPSYASLYPGDQYVDWLCLDGYNWGTGESGGWLSFSQLFSYSYSQLLALAPSKPIMLGEFASSENGGSKAAWITDALATQIPKHFPRVKAIAWYNSPSDEMDWPLESSQAATNAFRAAIAAPYYFAPDSPGQAPGSGP